MVVVRDVVVDIVVVVVVGVVVVVVGGGVVVVVVVVVVVTPFESGTINGTANDEKIIISQHCYFIHKCMPHTVINYRRSTVLVSVRTSSS